MEKTPKLILGLDPQDQKVWDEYVIYLQQNQIPNLCITPLHTQLSLKLDLHGMTIQAAWDATCKFVEQHHYQKTKNVIIITGKSGMIAHEFLSWMVNNPHVKKIEPIVDSRQQVGSYKVFLF